MIQHRFGSSRKILVKGANIISGDLVQQNSGAHFKKGGRGIKILVPIRLVALRANISRTDINGNDIETPFRNYVADENQWPIEKVKIVVGDTTLLRFWLSKLFSRSELFKKAGSFIE